MPYPTFDNYTNFAATTVATAPSPATTGTSLTVASGTGALLAGGGVPFDAVVWPAGTEPSDTNAEIVRVTAQATDTLTITRNTTVGTFLITTTINSFAVTLANGTATVPSSGTFFINGNAFGPGTLLTVTSTTAGTISQPALLTQSAVATRVGITESGGINRAIVAGDNIAANITVKALTDLQNTQRQGIYLAANVSTSTTTAVATTLSFAIGANQVFTFDSELSSSSSVTTAAYGVKFAVSAPTGATGMWTALGSAAPSGTGTTTTAMQGVVTTFSSATLIGPFNGTTATGAVFLQGNVVNGATPGFVTVYYASAATTGTQTLKAGSNLLAFRLA